MQFDSKNFKSTSALSEIRHDQLKTIIQGHHLLKRTMEEGCVENLESFLKTVSPNTDMMVRPHTVGAFDNGVLVGIVIGSYLVKTNVGFVAYAGVDEGWRQNKVYSKLRKSLLSLFKTDAAEQSKARLSYVVSEMSKNSFLFNSITSHHNTFVVPCNYEQPKTEGLTAKKLELLMQSVSAERPPEINEILCIIKEVFRGIYRIHNYESDPTFQLVKRSLLATNSGDRLTDKLESAVEL